MDVASVASTSTQYRQQTADSINRCVFYSAELKLSQMSTQKARQFIWMLNSLSVKSWNWTKLNLGCYPWEEIWSCLIVPRLEMFCPQLSPQLSVLNYYVVLSQLDYSKSYRSQPQPRQMWLWMVEKDFYLISLTFPLSAWMLDVGLPGQDVTFALSSAHYISVRFLPSSVLGILERFGDLNSPDQWSGTTNDPGSRSCFITTIL